jgi:dsRNA-specific ribonuclease
MADRRLDELGERLGLALHDPGALRQAFVHSSYFNEYPHDASGHNERLEFLGDAVVGLVDWVHCQSFPSLVVLVRAAASFRQH